MSAVGRELGIEKDLSPPPLQLWVELPTKVDVDARPVLLMGPSGGVEIQAPGHPWIFAKNA